MRAVYPSAAAVMCTRRINVTNALHMDSANTMTTMAVLFCYRCNCRPHLPGDLLPVHLLEPCSLVEWSGLADGCKVNICRGCRWSGHQLLQHGCTHPLPPTNGTPKVLLYCGQQLITLEYDTDLFSAKSATGAVRGAHPGLSASRQMQQSLPVMPDTGMNFWCTALRSARWFWQVVCTLALQSTSSSRWQCRLSGRYIVRKDLSVVNVCNTT